MNTKEIKSEFQFIGNSIYRIDLHNDFINIPDGIDDGELPFN